MSIVKRAQDLRKIIENLAQTLNDFEAVENPELFPEWKKETEYKAGEKVRHQGVLFRVLQDHNSLLNWSPQDAPSLYTRVLIPDSTIIYDWEQPLSTNPYMNGDKVQHKNSVWESIVDYNVWEPGVYGWKEI